MEKPQSWQPKSASWHDENRIDRMQNEYYGSITVTSIAYSCNYEHYLVTPSNFLL